MTQIAEGTTAGTDRQLTGLDRCDLCGAQAYVRVTLATGELYFCGHHATEFRDKLAESVVAWHDETDRLLSDAIA